MRRWFLAMAVAGCGYPPLPRVPDGSVDGGGADAGSDAAVVSWQLVQTRTVENTSGNATVPVAPVGEGHLVVVAAQIDDLGRVLSMKDSSTCNTYVAIPRSFSTMDLQGVKLELWYAKNSCAAAGPITIVATRTVSAAAIWEVAGARTDDPLHTAEAEDDQMASDSPVGPGITTSEAGEFVVAVVMAEFMITGIRTGNEFVNDHDTNGNGWGHLADPHAAARFHQAQWNQSPAGMYCSSAAAFRVGP